MTSWQRRGNDRRRRWAAYPGWLARRLNEDGCVAGLVRDRMAEDGHARGVYRVDMAYRRRARRYRAYGMLRKGSK